MVVKVAFDTAAYFKLPLLTAQSIHLALTTGKPLAAITAIMPEFFASVPFIGLIIKGICSNCKLPSRLEATVKIISLATFFYATHCQGFPGRAWVSSLTLSFEELSRLCCPKWVTIVLMVLNDGIYLSYSRASNNI